LVGIDCGSRPDSRRLRRQRSLRFANDDERCWREQLDVDIELGFLLRDHATRGCGDDDEPEFELVHFELDVDDDLGQRYGPNEELCTGHSGAKPRQRLPTGSHGTIGYEFFVRFDDNFSAAVVQLVELQHDDFTSSITTHAARGRPPVRA
jgi:hypothetical protein